MLFYFYIKQFLSAFLLFNSFVSNYTKLTLKQQAMNLFFTLYTSKFGKEPLYLLQFLNLFFGGWLLNLRITNKQSC